VAAFAAALYQVCTIFLQYYEYGVVVSKTVTSQRQTDFPAVTFCNMNPIRQSAIADNAALASLVASQTRRKRQLATDLAVNRSSYQSKRVYGRVKARQKRAGMSGLISFIYIYLYAAPLQ
jgi:hypothetical protein